MLKTYQEVIDGYQLEISRSGQGLPLVFLHGYPDNLHIWSELAPLLSQEFEIIAFDWPGMGRSNTWKGGATPSHMAERLLKIMDCLNIAKAILCGIDMGGQPALVFAANHPDRILGLIVMNSLVAPNERTSWEIQILRKFGWNRFLIRNFPHLIFARAEHTFLPRSVKLPQSLRDEFWECFRRSEVRSFISKMCAGYQGTLESLPDLYQKILCPTLILWGEMDKHFPPVHAHILHNAIPASVLKIIPEASHWMPLHCAKQMAETISAFVKSYKL